MCPIGLYRHCQDKVLTCVKNLGELSLEFQAVWSLPLAFPIKLRVHLGELTLKKNNGSYVTYRKTVTMWLFFRRDEKLTDTLALKLDSGY